MLNRNLKLLSWGVGGVWLSCLLGLTLVSSNPVTLNRQQIFSSEYVVQGRFDPESSNFLVEKTFPVGVTEKKLKFANLAELTFATDRTYLVPVVTDQDREMVTPSPMKNIPLIYLANQEAESQLKALLAENGGKR